MVKNIFKIRIKWGWGSFSLLLALLGIFWGFSFPVANQPFPGFCFGDWALGLVGLPAWSGSDQLGTHIGLIYSLLFYIPSVILGIWYKTDFGAKLGICISVALSSIMLILWMIYGTMIIFD